MWNPGGGQYRQHPDEGLARNASGPPQADHCSLHLHRGQLGHVPGGIDTFCALFTLFPVMLTICAEANIPRKYLIGPITCGVSTAALTPAPLW